jgi:hypothetical protein
VVKLDDRQSAAWVMDTNGLEPVERPMLDRRMREGGTDA